MPIVHFSKYVSAGLDPVLSFFVMSPDRYETSCHETIKRMSLILSMFWGIIDVFRDYRVQGLLAFSLMLITIASLVFWVLEDWSLIDAAFFSVATISTVGYGNVVPLTTAGKIFCMVYIFLGLGVFVATASAVAEALIQRRTIALDKRKGRHSSH